MRKHAQAEAGKVKTTPHLQRWAFLCQPRGTQLTPKEPQFTDGLVLVPGTGLRLKPSLHLLKEQILPLLNKPESGKKGGQLVADDQGSIMIQRTAPQALLVILSTWLLQTGLLSSLPQSRSTVQRWTDASISDHASTSKERPMVKAKLRQ